MNADLRGQLAPTVARARMLAGNATVTVVGASTRFTFKVQASDPEPGRAPMHFVKVLTGSDNESDFQYLGTIDARGEYRHGRKSKIAPSAPSALAFAWLWRNLPRAESEGAFPHGAQLWHEGRCCRCGRKLSVPESVAEGLGPDCAERAAA